MKKYRDKWRLFLVEGKRLCREALNSGWKIEKAFLREDFSLDSDSGLFGKILSERKIPLRMLKPDDFRKLADTENPQGIMLIVHKPAPREMREWLAAKPRILLVLDGIRDPGNMGTIIRSADWFGVS
ncbi:MAG: hypothetical protein JXL67_13530, partial [Calditrichaeota bacterium]|nr:hypothetical protein [Calditrichota bacterium]